MLDEAAIFLGCSWQEAWYVNKGDNRNIEAIAEPNKPSSLLGSVNIKNACKNHWLVCDNADRAAFNTRKTNNNIFGVRFLKFKKIAFINNFGN